MNIFWLSPDLEEACRWHVDTHVVKMPTEYCQLLSTAIHLSTTKVSPGTRVMATTHRNHPCAIWARESLSNWLLLRELALHLGNEYTYRYGKVHKSHLVTLQLPQPDIPDIGVTPLPLAMPDDVRGDDPFQSYRDLYSVHKRHLLKWKRRSRPTWSMTPTSRRLYLSLHQGNPPQHLRNHHA